jgi:ubiquinone/menaquinone biosynthesis C-methylase UbiE
MILAKPLYNKIGIGYSKYRHADSRIVDTLCALLNLPRGSIIADIGAGTGNYSNALADRGYSVKALEPSSEMVKQAQSHNKVEWTVGNAENMPFDSESVNGVVLILSLNHFKSQKRAASEIRRICPCGPIVFFTFDPRESEQFWLTEYFPEIWDSTYNIFPTISRLAQTVGFDNSWSADILPFPLPPDLEDRFLAACWNSPELYLKPEIRQCMSGFVLANEESTSNGLASLQSDLANGQWNEKHGHIVKQDSFDAGYRFVKLYKPKCL